MRLSIAACACLLAATVAYAQAPKTAAPKESAGSSSTSATPTTKPPASGTGAAATYTVTVGGPSGNKFVPATTNVKPGDVVKFMFPGSTHNVLQSDAPNGCTKSSNPLAKQFPAAGGLATAGSVWNYTVTPLSPTAKGVWMYCAPHCAGGMTTSLLLSGAAGGSDAGGAAGGASGDASGSEAAARLASAASSVGLGVAGKALALGSVAAGAVFLRL